jgi:hypothetical protein
MVESMGRGHPDEAEPTCARCGMEAGEWSESRGYVASSGEVFCCQSCAEGKGCTCESSLEKRESA